MADDVIVLTVGDLKPSLVHTVKTTAGTVVTFNESDAVFFRLVNAVTGQVALDDETATISDMTNGQVTYDWTAGDTSVAGYYEAQWKIVYAAGAVQHSKYPFPICIRDVDGGP